MTDMEIIRQGVIRRLSKLAPGCYVKVHVHPVKYGYLTVDLADGVTPSCEVKAPDFLKWIGSTQANLSDLKDLFWRKSGKHREQQMDFGFGQQTRKKYYED